MRYFKLLLLWLLPLLTIGSFTSAQCTESFWITSCPNWKCVWTNLIWISCAWWSDFQITYYCKDWSSWPNSWVTDFVSSSSIWSPCWWVWNLDYFTFRRYYWWNQNCEVLYNSDKMCTETFTPVITWLWDSINEFIPYVVYVGLGILWALIWFFAIRRLINRVRRQTFWVFKSKRRK